MFLNDCLSAQAQGQERAASNSGSDIESERKHNSLVSARMASIGDFTLAPLRSIHQWRETAMNARSIHPLVYYVWCCLGIPFGLVACFGYVFCVLTFPSMWLGLGLSFSHNQPGIGWIIWAVLVVLLWTTMFAMQIAGAVRQFRGRVLDIELLTSVLFMALSYLIAAWYVAYQIGQTNDGIATGA